MPTKAHGMNNLLHHHNVAVLSATNPTPAFYKFLDTFGLNSDEVKNALYRQTVYQSIMRSSLRNPEDQNRKTVFVMDRGTAEWLSPLFPGASISPLGEHADAFGRARPGGRPRSYASNAARLAAHRAMQKFRRLVQLDMVNGTVEPGRAQYHAKKMAPEMPALASGPVSPAWGSVFADKMSAETAAVLDFDGDVDKIIDALRECHAKVMTSKEDNILISPSIFRPVKGVETRRGLANVAGIFGIWFDNDGGDLTHEEFARLFPRLRMVCFNSYNSRPDAVRYRVFIPTSCMMSVEAHGLIVQQIVKSSETMDTFLRRKPRRACGGRSTVSTRRNTPHRPCSTPHAKPPPGRRHRSSSTTRTGSVCRSMSVIG